MANWEATEYVLLRKHLRGRIYRQFPGDDRWSCTVSAVNDEKSNLQLTGCLLSGFENAKRWIELTMAEVGTDT